jgi:hypothetical protein
MNHFNVSHFVGALAMLQQLELDGRRKCQEGQADGLVKDDAKMAEMLRISVQLWHQLCARLDLGRAHRRLVGNLMAPAHAGTLTFRHLQCQIPELLDDIDYDLTYRRFSYIEPDKAIKHDKFVKEWHPILESIPESAADCSDGMDCYALGLYTAGVFHAMRVAEFGLRRLAKRLRVKIKDNKQTIPIEYGDWNS